MQRDLIDAAGKHNTGRDPTLRNIVIALIDLDDGEIEAFTAAIDASVPMLRRGLAAWPRHALD